MIKALITYSQFYSQNVKRELDKDDLHYWRSLTMSLQCHLQYHYSITSVPLTVLLQYCLQYHYSITYSITTLSLQYNSQYHSQYYFSITYTVTLPFILAPAIISALGWIAISTTVLFNIMFLGHDLDRFSIYKKPEYWMKLDWTVIKYGAVVNNEKCWWWYSNNSKGKENKIAKTRKSFRKIGHQISGAINKNK